MLESHDLSAGNTKFLYFVNVGTPALAWIRNALFDRNHETGSLYSSAGLQFMLHSFTSDRDLEDRFLGPGACRLFDAVPLFRTQNILSSRPPLADVAIVPANGFGSRPSPLAPWPPAPPVSSLY
jgi:hypothetical protein